MNEFQNPKLVNEDVLDKMNKKQLKKILKMLENV